MKFHWGHKAFLLYTGFVVFILIMGFMAMRQQIDLVNVNYYEDELNYLEINKQKAAADALESPLKWEVGDNQVLFSFPANMDTGIKGEIFFYKPSDRFLDLITKVQVDSLNRQFVSLDSLSRGLYEIRVAWEFDSVSYFQEGTVFLP
jgi:FixH protein